MTGCHHNSSRMWLIFMTDFSKDRPMTGAGGPGTSGPPLQLGHDIYAKYGHSPGVLPSAASIGVARRAILFGMERVPLLDSIQRRLGGNVLPGSWPTLHYVWALNHAPRGYKRSQTIVSRSVLTPARMSATQTTIEREATPLTSGSIPSSVVAELPVSSQPGGSDDPVPSGITKDSQAPQTTSLYRDTQTSGVHRQRESSVQAVNASVQTVHLTHDPASNLSSQSGKRAQHFPESIIHRSADTGSPTVRENLTESSGTLHAANHATAVIANPHAPQSSALISPSITESATSISRQVSPSNLVHREPALGEAKAFSPGFTEASSLASTGIIASNAILLQRTPARNVSDAHSTAPDHLSTPAIVQRPIFARGRMVVSASSMQHGHPAPATSVSTSASQGGAGSVEESVTRKSWNKQSEATQNLIEKPLLSRSVADEGADRSAYGAGAAFVQLSSTPQTRSSLPRSTEKPMVKAEVTLPGAEIPLRDALATRTSLVHRKSSEDSEVELGTRPATSSVSLPKISLPETAAVIQRPMTIGEAHSATIVSRFVQGQSAEVMLDAHSTPYSGFVQRLPHAPVSLAVMPKRGASISSLGKEVSAQKTSMVMLDSASTSNHTVLASTLPSPTESSTAEGVSSALSFSRDNFAEESSPAAFSTPRPAAQGLVHKSSMFPAARGHARTTSPSLHRATALTMTHIAARLMPLQQGDTGSSTLPAPQVRRAPSVGSVIGASTGMPGSSGPASLPAAPSIAKSAAGFDLTQLANRVYELLVKRLASERQRRGF